jgi:hypothetical protein
MFRPHEAIIRQLSNGENRYTAPVHTSILTLLLLLLLLLLLFSLFVLFIFDYVVLLHNIITYMYTVLCL